MILTEEQNAIVKNKSSFLLVKAFAGSGKTTTLIEFAKARPDMNFLYLAFNSSVAKHANKVFPKKNVKVSTAHSLAYEKIGFKYKNKIVSRLRPSYIKNFLNLKNNREGNLISKILLDIINNFCYSAFVNIKDAFDYSLNYTVNTDTLVSYAEIIWERMIDFKSDFPILHDVYLKLYQLSCPKLNYDYILFDEAQDANPSMVAIIEKQIAQGVNVVMVGDEHQAIYAFRGAKNSLLNKKVENLSLTESFRFGENIANAINSILKVTKNEEKKIKGHNDFDFVGDVDNSKPFAIITRTNANLFMMACDIAEKGKKMYFVNGYESYQFYKIKDVENLYNENFYKIRDAHIKSFKGFTEMMDVAEQTDDKELIYLGKIVDKYKGNVSKMLKIILKHKVDNINECNIILSTAHKSKGLEFDQVMLTNDYINFFNSAGELLPNRLKEEEINILYVAASRAKMYLKPNGVLKKLIKYYEENKNSLNKVEKNNKFTTYKIFKSKKIVFKSKINKKRVDDE